MAMALDTLETTQSAPGSGPISAVAAARRLFLPHHLFIYLCTYSGCRCCSMLSKASTGPIENLEHCPTAPTSTRFDGREGAQASLLLAKNLEELPTPKLCSVPSVDSRKSEVSMSGCSAVGARTPRPNDANSLV